MSDEIMPEVATSEVGTLAIVLPRVYAVGPINGPNKEERFTFHIFMDSAPGAGGSGPVIINMEFDLPDIARERRASLIKEVNRYHMGNVAYATKMQTDAMKEAAEGMSPYVGI